jgi:hypothetical protein
MAQRFPARFGLLFRLGLIDVLAVIACWIFARRAVIHAYFVSAPIFKPIMCTSISWSTGNA